MDPEPYQALAISSGPDNPALFYVLSLMSSAILLVISALVSASEVALFSLSATQLDNIYKYEHKSDKIIARLLDQPKYLLSTILIVNNLVNVGLVTLSTFMMWEITGTKDSTGLAVVILTVVITMAIVFFGEITPKTVAYKNNLKLSRLIAPVVTVLMRFFWPLSWVLVKATGFIEKRIERKGYKISVSELNHALDISTGKETTKEEKSILKSIVNFGTISAKQIMRPRQDIAALDYECDFETLLKVVNDQGYSRMPVFKDTIDKIEGILYVKDLLPYIHEGKDYAWQGIIREGYFIPESKKIDDLLKDFQEKRVHLAVVVDEYGGTSGIITMEDIIEEIVGDINDEFDEKELLKYSKLDERTYVFEARTMLSDVSEVLALSNDVFDPVRGDAESLGGLVLELSQKLPRVGERLQFEHLQFTVVAADDKKVTRVKIEINQIA